MKSYLHLKLHSRKCSYLVEIGCVLAGLINKHDTPTLSLSLTLQKLRQIEQLKQQESEGEQLESSQVTLAYTISFSVQLLDCRLSHNWINALWCTFSQPNNYQERNMAIIYI